MKSIGLLYPLEQIIGCDLGLTHFLIDSNGKKIEIHDI